MTREDPNPEEPRRMRDTRPIAGRIGTEEDTTRSTNSSEWRKNRYGERATPSRGLPTDQRFIAWLQRGGWLLLAGLGGIAVIVILGLIVLRSQRPLLTTSTEPRATLAPIVSPQPLQPSVTTLPAISNQPVAPNTSQGARFVVSGTAEEGLFLRPQPSSEGAPLKTLPEGTVLTVIGGDESKPDRVWKHVRDPDGSEGYVAADFVKPATP